VYRSIDSAITFSYHDDQLRWEQAALTDALALIPASKPTATKAEVTTFLHRRSELEPFEKEGCVWFDNLGIKFDDNERIVHVSRRWSFGEADPCFPD
jgi:hypothetical protein